MTWAHWLLVACWAVTVALCANTRTDAYKWAGLITNVVFCVLYFRGYLK